MMKSKKNQSRLSSLILYPKKPKRSRKQKVMRAGLFAAGISLFLSGIGALTKKETPS